MLFKLSGGQELKIPEVFYFIGVQRNIFQTYFCNMKIFRLKPAPLILLLILLISCSENPSGSLVENLSPETYCVTDTIIRSGNNRYSTTVEVSWWGDDPDGYIIGFELSSDKKNWVFTKNSDSIFTVEIPDGTDTFDFLLYVRAIDNHGRKDPSPAYIYIPVRNSPPAVSFVYLSGYPARRPESSFPVLRFSWIGSDPDGTDNISYYEIALNDTANGFVKIDKVFSTLILKTEDFNSGIAYCDILQGNNLSLHPSKIYGLKLNDSNQLIIRAVDKVGENSALAYSDKIYVRKPSSGILLVNAYNSSIQAREDFYSQNLNNCGIVSFDFLRINEISGDHYTQLSPDNTVQSLVFSLFNTIIWFGKDIDFSMSLAQKTTEIFFNKGGKMFMAVEIASSIDEQAGYLDFSPIDSLVSLPQGVNNFRIESDSILEPLNPSWPVLKSTKISNARPFYEESGASVLYNAHLVKTGTFGKAPWTGKSAVMAKKVNSKGKTIFIISSVELHNMNGNSNMTDLFTKIFIDELEIK